MGKFIIFWYILTIVIIFINFQLINCDINVIVSKISQCKNKTDLPIQLKKFEIKQVLKNDYRVYGSVEIKEDYPEGFKVNYEIRKCDDIKQLTSCLAFLKTSNPLNICKVINDPVFGSDLQLKNIVTPELTCPLKSGIYKVIDMKVNSGYFNSFATRSVTYWYTVIKVFDDDLEIGCGEITASIRPRRKTPRKY